MMISCKNITKSFSEQVVLDSFSYDFKENGFYLLFGESGSGKTTLLNVLSGFLPFENGKITWKDNTFFGKVDNSIIEKDFDYITQDAYFVDFLTVMDNMRLVSEDDAKITETLKRFGLGETADRNPVTLSGGEKQRLAIARALLNKKKVLFLDEPTASLDEKNKISVFNMLAELKQSVFIICSSHDDKAKEYADEIVHFSKSKRKADASETCKEASTAASKKQKKQSSGLTKKTNSMPFLKKWFASNKRSRRSNLLFGTFLVLAMCLCVLADTPENKLESSIEYMYKINVLTVETSENLKWADIALESDKIRSVVLDYEGSIPMVPENSGSGEVTGAYYEMLNVLPFEKDSFKLLDNIIYGTYFTEENQILISLTHANKLSPSAPERLIGETLRKNVYGLGEVELEIVGIFGEFDDFEVKYMDAVGLSFANDTVAVNSKLIEKLESDESFYNFGSNGRQYKIYFDSFGDMKDYYDKFTEHIADNENVRVYYNNFNSILDVFEIMFVVIMPIAFFIALFATLFFVSLQRIEFMHNSRFISVFEYSGYSKSKVINQYIFLNILEFVKLYGISALIAFVITIIVNTINRYVVFVNFQIFSYNILTIAVFMLFMILVMLVFANVFFRKVKVRSWYENMICGRDLI